MVQAKTVVDDDSSKNKKKSNEGKRGKIKWAAIGAVVVLVVAIALTSKHAQNYKPCQCSKVWWPFFFILLGLKLRFLEVDAMLWQKWTIKVERISDLLPCGARSACVMLDHTSCQSNWNLLFVVINYTERIGLYLQGIKQDYIPHSFNLSLMQDSRKYTGIVEDCCCDYETVDSLNGAVLHPLLQEVVKTPFFRYFKVKLWCDCPFWPDDGMCKLRDCSVCECPENEFPESFKKAMHYGLPSDDLKCQEGKPEAAVDRTLDSKVFRGWIEVDNPWTHDDETDNSEMTYVNLQLNPERYTGYTGPSARRIWDAIYSENCPKCQFLFIKSCTLFPLLIVLFVDFMVASTLPIFPFLDTSGEICQEKRVLYKLISGLHSSISIHIASDYLLDETKNLWGRNLELMYDRVLRYPDRVRNLYFTFLFVLRAVTKATNYLEQAEYDTGNMEEDLKAQSLVRQLLYNPKLQAACPLPFDEAKLWQGQSGPELKQEIQKHFRNISALMDCVGCEKCRLWGKLQVLGLGTALKILFSVDGKIHSNQPLQLQRNEVIALVNLLNRLSESVKLVNEIGPSIDKSMGEFTSEVSSQENSLWQSLWKAIGHRYITTLCHMYARVPSQSIVIHMLSLLVRVWGKAGLGGARELTAGSSHVVSEPIISISMLGRIVARNNYEAEARGHRVKVGVEAVCVVHCGLCDVNIVRFLPPLRGR
ncbi:hypothetical protein BUALT_Bualt18G0038200 [Buddleja alternifolia]|uniref:Uncharacterized protein n=1 Tax=Buddleja alternifolia TaxID=168488 RepID=A0AAV6W496_9LAMI|nr:hypothetical protein BUALT_Bualt18G0038200 [Buddleja alternifolia]